MSKKINNTIGYQELNNELNKYSADFQNKYPYLWIFCEKVIRGNAIGAGTQRLIPSYLKLLTAYFYQRYFFWRSNKVSRNKKKVVVLSLPNFSNLEQKMLIYLRNNNYIEMISYRSSLKNIKNILNDRGLFLGLLGLPMCNYTLLHKLLKNKKFIFTANEELLLDQYEKSIKNYVLSLSGALKRNNIKAVFSTGSTSYSSSIVCLAANEIKINYSVLAHGYIQSSHLITLAPIRSKYLLVWSRSQVKMLKNKLKYDEFRKVLYLGFPGNKLTRSKESANSFFLLALEPIEKLALKKNSLNAVKYILRELKNHHHNVVVRPHPKNYGSKKDVARILEIDYKNLSKAPLDYDLSNSIGVISVNSSVLIQSSNNNIPSFQIEEGALVKFEDVPSYDSKSLVSILLDGSYEQCGKHDQLERLDDNIDRLVRVLLFT